MRVSIATGGVVLALFLAACGEGNVFSLQVGECINQPSGVQISDVTKVGCDDPHENEVYALFDLDGGGYPGGAAVEVAAVDGCLDRFAPYVGTDFDSSRLDISWLEPTRESWSAGDHEVVCMLSEGRGSLLTGSMKDSGV